MTARLQAPEDDRRARIEKRWPRHQWDSSGQSRWAGWDWRNYLYVIICALLLSGTILEVAISNDGNKEPWWPFGLLTESPVGFAFLIMSVVANGWVVDRSLADRTPGSHLVPIWLRWLRRALASIPVVGLYTIPAWRWIIQTRPSWAFRTSARPRICPSKASETLISPLSRLHAWSHTLRRRQGRSLPALLLWMIAGQVAPWTALLSWATTAETLSSGHRRALFALSAACHILACVCGLQYGAIRGRQTRVVRWQAAAIRFAPLFFLPPFPFFFVGLLLWMILAGEEAETLVGRSYSNKSRPPAHAPLGKGSSINRPFSSLSRGKQELDAALNGLLPGTVENSEVKGRQLSFFRLKTFLLILDAAALAWIFVRLGGPSLSFASLLAHLAPFLLLSALGVLIGLAFLAMRVTGWLLRRAMPYQPYGRSLTFTQLALAAGLLFGPLLAADQARNAGLLLTAIGIGTAVASTLLLAPLSFLMMLPGRQTFVILAWGGLFFELFITGLVMQYHPELAPPFLRLFQAAIALTPVWSLVLFLGLHGWLLHPFELKHLFDRRLPRSIRAVLATVALTAAVPLGGIAIPFWIYAHHRLWPRYEKLLLEVKGTGTARP